MVDVGKELFCALDFTFLQGTFLQGEVSLPRRGRKPEELLIHDLERTFDWTRHSGVTVFPSARGSKNRYPAEGASPRGYWYTVWRERSDWTRHSGVTVFPSARGSKNRYPAEGASPRGYWYTVWRERSDWTRTSEAKIFRAREEPKISTTPYATVALDSNQTEPGAGAPAPAYGGVVTGSSQGNR